MARPLRVQYEDAIYHLCARGNAGEQIFRGEKDRARFVELLEESAQRFAASIFCFVLMGNHFHLIAQTHRANLTRWMHWLSVAYTVYFNRRHRRSGHLFQGRFKSFLVQGDDGYLLTLSRYVHLNPVRGVVLGRGTPTERRERLRNFKWSTYVGYGGLGRQWPFAEESLVLNSFGAAPRPRRLEYRRYVEGGLLREIDNPFEAVRWQAVLGSESFVQTVRDRIIGSNINKQRREIKPLRDMDSTVESKEVLERVAKKYKLDVMRLVEGEHGLEARNVAMWMLWEGGGKTLREIGQVFGGMDYAAVAQRIRRARAALDDKSAANLRGQILNL